MKKNKIDINIKKIPGAAKTTCNICCTIYRKDNVTKHNRTRKHRFFLFYKNKINVLIDKVILKAQLDNNNNKDE